MAGVVLAAGSSTRMGRNKLFFELDGETLLRRVVRRALDAGLDPVLVVVGHESARARAELAGTAVHAGRQPRPRAGGQPVAADRHLPRAGDGPGRRW